jgi:hypothetical protein
MTLQSKVGQELKKNKQSTLTKISFQTPKHYLYAALLLLKFQDDL